MSNMRWSEAPLPDPDGGGGNGGNGSSSTTPQIKNHSVTHHRGHLYCFGGYDGRRNHQTLLIYSLRDQRWITPSPNGNRHHVNNHGDGNGGGGSRGTTMAGGAAHFTVRGVPPPGRNGHTATLATCRSPRRRGGSRRRRGRGRRNNLMVDPPVDGDAESSTNDGGDGGIDAGGAAATADPPPSEAEEVVEQALSELASAIDAMDAQLEKHPGGNNRDDDDGDDDDEHPNDRDAKNENGQGGDDVDVPNPNERNPNEDMDDENNNNNNQVEQDDDDEDAQIIIIGGWLGSGPLAASDMWVLDISGGLDRLRWFQPPTLGTPPGPCNMHSADFIPALGEVYVFRGGNGREYLNDLHALDVESYAWRAVETRGTPPQQRANHSSALLCDNTADGGGNSELFIFGGWNGNERLNDIHVLDTATSTWSTPRVLGVKPMPRAGMTLTALRGRLYLFGGSGTSSKCFDDLQVLDRAEMTWMDVREEDDTILSHQSQSNGVNGGGNNFGTSYYDNSWEMVGNGGGGEDGNNHHRDNRSSWEMLGGQDGMMMGGGGDQDNDNVIKFADWRSYSRSAGAQPVCSSANPNDEDTVPSVHVNGKPPGRRAGHTATAVGRHIYVFGGSCGTDYLNDFFVLDTDPPPSMKITSPPSPQLYASRLRHFYNDEEFSDVTFLVEGRKVYGHKLVLSTVSDCFRAMFMTGFRESGSGETTIEIPNCSYGSFVTMMEYIYTGRGPSFPSGDGSAFGGAEGDGMDRAVALLELADQFFLYNLKQIIEGILQPAVNGETYVYLRQVAQKTNAGQLESYCRYFERNMSELLE